MLIIVAVIGAALIGWLYVSKGTTAQQAQHADAVKRSLSLFGMPLAWAMRREMTAGDLDQVHQ